VKVLEQKCFVVCIEMFVFEAKGDMHLRTKPEYGNTFDPDLVASQPMMTQPPRLAINVISCRNFIVN